MNIIGFSFIRNAIKYDYPFMESFKSLLGVCDQFYLSVCKSEDDTTKHVSSLPRTTFFDSFWDDNLREGGKIFSQQTNFILEKVKNDYTSNDWGFYIQADEVILESQYQKIINDIKFAHENGYDAVRFRYLHFWQQYHKIAINKRWYPQEIRAIKLKPEIKSAGDAQSFSGVTKVYDSDCFIFHYGHVRDQSAYEAVKNYKHRFWHEDEGVKKEIEKSKISDQHEKTINYFGPHPKLMEQRINKKRKPAEEVFLLGNKQDFDESFIESINAHKIHWVSKIPKDKNSKIDKIVNLKPSLINNIFIPSKVPKKMDSPQARVWPKEFIALLRLSEKNISSNSI